ncbi:hypothetical protein [Streptomyces sp. CB01201]|uniref:hypothetical protein n=1 Tax=Streptomyces sp. CB01201 TaxID=2020324 RepID=UPI001F246367|nr:hypothetical protein [Streptomyces sp. CB01201]
MIRGGEPVGRTGALLPRHRPGLRQGEREAPGRAHQREAERAQRPEDDPQNLFTEACLHGLKAKLCNDVDSLGSYLPPQVVALARKVAEVLEVPELAAT